MIAKFFDAPIQTHGVWNTLAGCHSFDTNRIVDYTYTKRWSRVGEFEMTLPFNSELLLMLAVNGFICFDDGGAKDWLWIQDIDYSDGASIRLAGKDCKGLLDTRIALPDSALVQGYDAVEGTTAHCLRHYLNNNCIGQTGNDAVRNLPLAWVGGSSGSANDSYMARFEYLSTIFTELCDGAGIGYDIRGDLSSTAGTVPFTVHTFSGSNRTIGQNARPRVIFSLYRRNVTTLSFSHGVSDLYNAVYATGSDNVTLVTNRDVSAAEGVARRECNVTVSVPTSDSWYSKYAIDQVRDNTETHSYTFETAASGYGSDYYLGDFVTVLDDYTGSYYNDRITEITKRYSANENKITIKLGTSKQKPLNKLINSFISGTARKK